MGQAGSRNPEKQKAPPVRQKTKSPTQDSGQGYNKFATCFESHVPRNKISKKKIVVKGAVALIPLTQGYTAKIDVADLALVAGPGWQIQRNPSGNIYASRKQRIEGKRKTIYLHRLISGAPADKVADHINGDGLDCRRTNLRLCEPEQNMRNLKCHRGGQLVGVHYNKTRRVYYVKVRIGTFTEQAEAAAIANAAERLLQPLKF
jgi:hypothetical protein